MKKIIAFSIAIMMCISLCACGTSQYDKDLQSALDKFKNGEKMTEKEKSAVNDVLNYNRNK